MSLSNYIYILWLKTNLTQFEFIFLLSVSISLFAFLVSKINKKLNKIFIATLAVMYFGPLATAIIATCYISANLAGNLFSGVLIQTSIFTVISLATNNIHLSFLVVLCFSLVNILINYKKIYQFKIYQPNFIETVYISLSFLMSSMPQYHWDATQANLYNAKQYVLANNFNWLIESISSLFPQQAISYFSFFYKLSGDKGIQLALLLPLYSIISNINSLLSSKKNFITPLLISAPMFVFQTTSGYYDLLITACILNFFYSLIQVNYFQAAISLGFAGAAKYFAIIFSPLLLKRNIIFTALPLLMLSIWMVRSFLATSNPFFPFAQNIFPTPTYWKGESIEYNFMIQSTITLKDWLKGGFLTYPYAVYKDTSTFMESTKTFSGYFPLIFIASFLLSLFFIIKNKKYTKISFYVLACLVGYFVVGLATRYYRYLFPFMTVSFILNVYFLIKNKHLNYYFLAIICIITTVTNFTFTRDYFKTQGLEFNNILNPDAYFESNTKFINNKAILFVNIYTNNNPNTKILDITTYKPNRLHLTGHVFQCNWYWTGLDTQVSNKSPEEKQNIADSFNLIITDNLQKIKKSPNCPSLSPDLSNRIQIYNDDYYTVYK